LARVAKGARSVSEMTRKKAGRNERESLRKGEIEGNECGPAGTMALRIRIVQKERNEGKGKKEVTRTEPTKGDGGGEGETMYFGSNARSFFSASLFSSGYCFGSSIFIRALSVLPWTLDNGPCPLHCWLMIT
jgi:hypothetical protein